ncbi:Inorganic triphosphatase [wastewater metagenome]|uniref:Inorganic triphosphatase n=2 Tax=unclassified sequences TaxID=12908 RepID=A0A5B8RJW6_9ZZZZ|nr:MULTISPECIES: CYTH domain-containing protein [Arhodomonas]MCS4503288.1 CYTH domain-containing protein [Arhodomonas aquaeolei]QEA07864.1 inorganic triphosphatase [uncultured organism]
MAEEIERKFLVTGDAWRDAADAGQPMRQGYLGRDIHASVRVRLAGARAWLNIKGATLGVQRREYEYAIPADEAQEMLDHLCHRPLIEKTRYHVPVDGHTWEVDVFEGDNAGLVVAEVELASAEEAFTRPEWAGREVSHLPRYYNVSLVRYPYSEWTAAERTGD